MLLLRISGFDTLIAISGDEVLVGGSSASGSAQLRAVPATGGAPVTRFLAQAREGFSVGLDALDASAERVAFILRDDGPGVQAATAFVGPPSGPFRPVTTGTLRQPHDATGIDVDGARVLLLESDGEANSFATVIDADGSRTQIRLPDDVEAVRLSGDLIGISSDSPSARRTCGSGCSTAARARCAGGPCGMPAISSRCARMDSSRRSPTSTTTARSSSPPRPDAGDCAPSARPRRRHSTTTRCRRRSPATACSWRRHWAAARKRSSGHWSSRPAAARHSLPVPRQSSFDTAAISDRWVAWLINECIAAVPRAALPAAEALGPGPCPRAELASW